MYVCIYIYNYIHVYIYIYVYIMRVDKTSNTTVPSPPFNEGMVSCRCRKGRGASRLVQRF